MELARNSNFNGPLFAGASPRHNCSIMPWTSADTKKRHGLLLFYLSCVPQQVVATNTRPTKPLT